jgi:hypothetical protein
MTNAGPVGRMARARRARLLTTAAVFRLASVSLRTSRGTLRHAILRAVSMSLLRALGVSTGGSCMLRRVYEGTTMAGGGVAGGTTVVCFHSSVRLLVAHHRTFL